MNFAFLASSNGSDLPAIFQGFRSGNIIGNMVCGITNKKNTGAESKFTAEGIAHIFIDHEGKGREEFDKELHEVLKKYKVDYIVCVGFMRILSSWFVSQWKEKILNVHPALLPAFPGAHAIDDALKYGVKVTGATIHFIDEGVDTGKILAQKAVEITEADTLDTVKQKIQAVEQELYPQVLAKISHTSL